MAYSHTSHSQNIIPQHGESFICVYAASSKGTFWSDSAMLFLNSGTLLCYVYLPQNKISINLKVFKSYKKHSLTVVQFTLEIKTKDFWNFSKYLEQNILLNKRSKNKAKEKSVFCTKWKETHNISEFVGCHKSRN